MTENACNIAIAFKPSDSHLKRWN